MQIEPALEKLLCIQESWKELQRTKANTPEYATLMKKIQVLSAEYQALVEASKNPEKPKSPSFGAKAASR
jgi:hypothetical protein